MGDFSRRTFKFYSDIYKWRAMPISIEGLLRAGLEQEAHIISSGDNNAPAPYYSYQTPILADIIVLPPPYPFLSL